MVQSRISGKLSQADRPLDGSNALHDLGYKIFLDRYAQKDMTRATLTVGDTVIVVVDSATGQREVGKIAALKLPQVTIELLDGTEVTRDVEHVDKPIETTPEQMMDRVAAGIADVETSSETKAEWTANFRWLLDGWKFVPGGRILTGAGTDQNLTYFNCMPPEQEILTNEGYKPIGDIQIGDRVVTHRNRQRPVTAKFERETIEALYIIEPKKLGYDALRVTGDHKILVIRDEWVNKHRSRDGLRLAQEPTWIPAKELKPGDYVAAAYDGVVQDVTVIRVSDYVGMEDYVGREASEDHNAYGVIKGQLQKIRVQRDGAATIGKPTIAINNELVVDEALCYLFGRWLGDGCITHRAKTNIPFGIKIVFGLDEREEADEIAKIIESKFGIPASIKLSSTKRWLDLWVNSMPVGEFFKSLLGQYSYGKRIPETLMHLPDHLTIELLRGLFTADGYISRQYLGMALSNRELAVQVHQLLLRLGYLFSITENTHRLGKVPAYRISATASECALLIEKFFGVQPTPVDKDQKYYIEYDDLRWIRINRITIEQYRGVVMDIEVEEDHSFVSAGIVVSNCYVIPSPRDSREGIIKTLGEMTEIMSRGGGVGINISSLRPRHAYVKGVNGRSSGSVSWGALYSFVTGLIEQGGSRRGALMIILNDWHPDVFDFINSKRKAGNITNANISVGISDTFMERLKEDGDWDLVFPDTSDPAYDSEWNGQIEEWIAAGHKVITHRTVKAREVWNAIIESAWSSAEPGIWFRERSNKMSNSHYYNSLISTNPCGEQALSAYSVCNLGAINLAKFYDADAHDVAWDDLRDAVHYSVRFLDNVIDSTPYFMEENARVQGSERRIGLGTMGIAELMISLGVRYGSQESLDFIDRLYAFITIEAYKMSSRIAHEKGAFAAFDAEKFLQSGFMQTMPEDVRAMISRDGIRNVTLVTQAPTGTTGTMVNTSTGIEPFFSWVYYRKSRLGLHEERVPVAQRWYDDNPGATELPDYFVTAMDLSPDEHVRVQAAFQRWIDSSISKTANLPNDYTVEQVGKLYEYMYELGCKGGTVYRDGSRDEQVLMLKGDERAEKEMERKAPKQEAPKDDKIERVATPHRVYPRPRKLTGITVNADTPFGTAYITMNSDEHGYPFEVFITAPGKAGSDLQADAEGLGRMVSLSLRTTDPHNRRTMLRLIIEQLRDIGGARSVGFGQNRVISLPDAVGRALEENFFAEDAPQQLGLPMTPQMMLAEPEATPKLNAGTANPSVNGNGNGAHSHASMSGADLCPSCANITLLRVEGCRKCLTCGYTEC